MVVTFVRHPRSSLCPFKPLKISRGEPLPHSATVAWKFMTSPSSNDGRPPRRLTRKGPGGSVPRPGQRTTATYQTHRFTDSRAPAFERSGLQVPSPRPACKGIVDLGGEAFAM